MGYFVAALTRFHSLVRWPTVHRLWAEALGLNLLTNVTCHLNPILWTSFRDQLSAVLRMATDTCLLPPFTHNHSMNSFPSIPTRISALWNVMGPSDTTAVGHTTDSGSAP